MGKLEDVSVADLRGALAEAESAKAAERLMVALSYRDGESVATMSDRYGIPTSTLYYWLDRFEERGIEGAITDEQRPGRPPKLDDDQRAALAETLAEPPSAAGVEAAEWTPERVQAYVEREFSVTYSTGHVRRLVEELTGGH